MSASRLRQRFEPWANYCRDALSPRPQRFKRRRLAARNLLVTGSRSGSRNHLPLGLEFRWRALYGGQCSNGVYPPYWQQGCIAAHDVVRNNVVAGTALEAAEAL